MAILLFSLLKTPQIYFDVATTLLKQPFPDLMDLVDNGIRGHGLPFQ